MYSHIISNLTAKQDIFRQILFTGSQLQIPFDSRPPDFTSTARNLNLWKAQSIGAFFCCSLTVYKNLNSQLYHLRIRLESAVGVKMSEISGKGEVSNSEVILTNFNNFRTILNYETNSKTSKIQTKDVNIINIYHILYIVINTCC